MKLTTSDAGAGTAAGLLDCAIAKGTLANDAVTPAKCIIPLRDKAVDDSRGRGGVL